VISLRQIHYALAVEETLHFRKAAQRCSISQSALSTALAEMEKQLGFQIFERNYKNVLVTPLGPFAANDSMECCRFATTITTQDSLGARPTPRSLRYRYAFWRKATRRPP
jgi:hypothetical protein